MRDQLEAIARDYMSQRDIPGTAIAVTKNGQVAEEFSLGLANIAEQTPATPRTLWPICSLTKSFTCTAVMQLVESGDVDVNAPVQRYLPNWRVKNPGASAQISVKHLMHHGSGIGLPGFQERVRTETPNPYPTRESLMAALADVELQSPPGKFWSYSNEGYSTLGHIVETVSGIRLEDYFATRIFQRLGMSDTKVRFPDWRSTPGRVYNYTREGSGEIATDERHGDYLVAYLPEDYQTYLSTGGITSTAHDLALYQAAAMNYADGPPLNADSLTEMQSVAYEYGDTGWGYGYGWFVWYSGDTKIVGHAGGMVGVSTYSLFIPSEQTGVILLTNRGGFLPFLFAEQLLGAARGKPIWRNSPDEPMPFKTSYRLPPNRTLADYEGDYTRPGVVARARVTGERLRIERAAAGEPEILTSVPVGLDTFLGEETAQVAHFVTDHADRPVTLLLSGFAYTRDDA